jgi:hypothetical protein
MEIHRRALMLLGSLCRDKESLEGQLLERQSLRSTGSSWFSQIRKLLAKYNLPSPNDLLLHKTPSKYLWKRMVNRKVKRYWREAIVNLASLTSTTRHLCTNKYYRGIRHPIVTSVTSCPKDAKRVQTKLMLATGTYNLQCNRATFNQHEVNPTCLLCNSADETPAHFVLQCPKLEETRKPVLSELYQCVDTLCGPGFADKLDSATLLQLILDCNVLICSDKLPPWSTKM